MQHYLVQQEKHFRAYVYKLDGNKLEVIHLYANSPQKCKHSEKMQYLNPMEELSESNCDSDFDNLDNDGKKIFQSGSIESTDQKNKMFIILIKIVKDTNKV